MRILIVDDHDVVRRGVRQILETQEEWEIVGEASDGQEALGLNQQLKPDAVVMDITMPVMNGFDATSEIVKADPHAKVQILYYARKCTFGAVRSTSGSEGVDK